MRQIQLLFYFFLEPPPRGPAIIIMPQLVPLPLTPKASSI